MTNDSAHEDSTSSNDDPEDNKPGDAGVEDLPVVAEAERILTEAAARVAAPSMELLQWMSDALTRNRVLHKVRSDRLLIGFAAERSGTPGFRIQVRMVPSNADVIIVDFRADRTGALDRTTTELSDPTLSRVNVALLQFANTWNQSHRWPAVVVERRNSPTSSEPEAAQSAPQLAAKHSMVANIESAISVERTMMMFIRTSRDLFRRVHASGY